MTVLRCACCYMVRCPTWNYLFRISWNSVYQAVTRSTLLFAFSSVNKIGKKYANLFFLRQFFRFRFFSSSLYSLFLFVFSSFLCFFVPTFSLFYLFLWFIVALSLLITFRLRWKLVENICFDVIISAVTWRYRMKQEHLIKISLI
jgi:hypothetical protein